MSYIHNIKKITEDNTNFRTVLYTGPKSQLVTMNITVDGEIGEETHPHVEQTLYIESGNGKAVLDGEETEITAGSVVVVAPGVKHNILNTGESALKIWTVYAPANHIDGRIHETKADADADTEDEEFGHRAE
ncbi:MAG: cupin domain-containing protein [Patescibacteria group bacterium]